MITASRFVSTGVKVAGGTFVVIGGAMSGAVSAGELTPAGVMAGEIELGEIIGSGGVKTV
jgi:hypothetical protein